VPVCTRPWSSDRSRTKVPSALEPLIRSWIYGSKHSENKTHIAAQGKSSPFSSACQSASKPWQPCLDAQTARACCGSGPRPRATRRRKPLVMLDRWGGARRGGFPRASRHVPRGGSRSSDGAARRGLREHARGRQGCGLARAGSAHALPGGGDRINRCISALPAHHDGVSVPSASPRARCSHHRDVGVCAALPVSELRFNL